ncbi:unnamed protein product [Auanema sp. JU1783]|nr:unnamed protein product [Auanema sp. JU1783]
MVLYVPCISSSTSFISSSTSLSTSSCSSPVYESTTCYSQPIPLRSQASCDDSLSTSTLSSSVESLSSLKSTCSSRWSAEREAERAEKRRLLNGSLTKLRSNNNLPLRKHLLVFNSIKYLQRELDLLDDEELYCSLMSSSDEAMEVDERRWLAPTAQQAPQTVAEEPAPPVVEEREAPAVVNSSSSNNNKADETDMEIGENKTFNEGKNGSEYWGWTMNSKMTAKKDPQSCDLFDSMEEALNITSGWSWTSSEWPVFNNTFENIGCNGLSTGGSSFGGSSPVRSHSNFDEDTWTPLSDFSDPFASCLSRFELQHLFPSQLLLQA